MSKRLWCVFTGLCALLTLSACAVPMGAQTAEVREKPPMLSYIANWQVPRDHWADMEKVSAAEEPIFQKAMADGIIVGYGNDKTLVHTTEGETHDGWWSATSMAGLMKVLDQLLAADMSASPASANPTKHWDEIYVSRYYNWKPGSYKGGYVQVAAYKLKADAPDDALSLLSKNMFVPLLEKLLADGTILEYEIDTQAIHTDAPGMFAIVTVSAQPEGLDMIHMAISRVQREHPMDMAAFASMEDFSGHRDELLKGNGTFK